MNTLDWILWLIAGLCLVGTNVMFWIQRKDVREVTIADLEYQQQVEHTLQTFHESIKTLENEQLILTDFILTRMPDAASYLRPVPAPILEESYAKSQEASSQE